MPSGTKSRSVTCEIKTNRLKVGLKGQEPIIDVSFFPIAISVNASYWFVLAKLCDFLYDNRENSSILSSQTTASGISVCF